MDRIYPGSLHNHTDYSNIRLRDCIIKVEDLIERAHCLIIASDFKEGWAAVVNEGLASACPVLSSHSVGSCPVLIKDGKNGFAFELKNIKQLSNYMKLIIKQENFFEYSRAAYDTTFNSFNAKIAANRFLELVRLIKENKDTIYLDGPCSNSHVVKNNWIKK